MATALLQTKLHIPSFRQGRVSRPCLIERQNAGISGKLTLVFAPVGFGKTTLIAERLAGCGRSFTWLSFDEHDDDPIRFHSQVVAALPNRPFDR